MTFASSGERVLFQSPDDRRMVRAVGGGIHSVLGSVDVVVVSDDNYLSHGGGVSAVVWRLVGAPLDAWAQSREGLARPRLGDVLVAPVDGHPSGLRHVLHAITIDFDEDRFLTSTGVGDLFLGVLRALESLPASGAPYRVAMPLLGAGAGGVPREAALAAFIEMARNWARLGSKVESFTLVDPGLAPAVLVPLQSADRGMEEASSSGPFGSWGRIAGAVAAGGAAVAMLPVGGVAAALIGVSTIAAGVGLLPKEGRARTETGVDDDARVLSRMLACAGPVIATPSPTVAVLAGQAGGVPQLSDMGGAALRVARLLQDALGRLDGAGPEASFSQLVRAASPRVGQSLATTLQMALDTRNLIVHARSEPDVQQLRVLLDASDALLSQFPEASPPPVEAAAVGMPVPPEPVVSEPGVPPDHAVAEHAASEVSVDPPAEDGGPPSPRGDTSRLAAILPTPFGGTRHVFELRDFLQSHLDRTELEALRESLVKQGYKGNFEDQLLEYCVRLDDPARKLASLFRESELRRALTQMTGVEPDASLYSDTLSQRILEHIGFPSATPLMGLAGVRRAFEAARRRVGLHDRPGLVGEIVGLGARMESLLSLLLRFHCTRATGLAARAWWEQSYPNEARAMDKPSLGTLVTAVHRLDAVIQAGAGPTFDRYRMVFPSVRLHHASMRVLPELRNHFSHERAGQGGVPIALADLRVHGISFIERGLEVLNHLATPMGEAGRLCPYLIRVERVVQDAFARRTVEAVNDEGHHEVLFTEEDLRPGQVYLMNPLTNPLRVTPVLVPVADSLQPR